MSAAPEAAPEVAPQATPPRRGKGRPFTTETGRQAQARSSAARSKTIEAPTDEEIELGLRRRATTSAKDAEVLLRWLARPRVEGPGLGLDELPEAELEALYRRLLDLARMSPDQLNHAVSGP